MNKLSRKLYKVFSVISGLSLVLNSILPASIVFAQEVTPTDTPTETIAPTPEPTVSPEITPETTVEPTETSVPTEEVTPAPPTEEVTPTPSEVSQPSETGPPAEGQILDGATTEAPTEAPTPTTTPDAPKAEGELQAIILENVEAQSLNLDNVDPTNSATLTTDKADYAPTDTVLISGTGFLPNNSYTLTISSNDPPPVSIDAEVISDGNGEFLYAYQLDGTYRPNYSIVAKDNGAVIATTTFTDSPISGCTNDTAGANDEPGQKDLTKMCVSYSGLPTSIAVTWNWDENGPGGNVGGNTGDACSLYDTDGDGFVNYSLCVIIDGDPSTYISKALYSCSDAKSDRCTNPVSINSASVTSSCTANVQNTDPFPAGDDYPQDSVASCTVNMSDVGGVGVAELIDVCSYPSQEPNSDPSDCIVFRDNTGRLEVVKDLVPSTDTGKFNLQIDSVTQATDVGDGGTTGEEVVTAGNHTVGEIAGTGTALTGYSTAIVCKDLNGTGTTVASGTNAGPLTVAVSEGDDIVCTITNTLQNGTIVVHKDVLGPNGEALTDTSNNFTVALDGTDPQLITDDGTVTYLDVTAGSHAITETVVPTGYSLYSITPVTANVVAGQTTDVYVINRQQAATVTIHKNVINPDGGEVADTHAFTVQKDGGSDDTIAEGNDAVYTVNPGTYTFTELADANYTLDSITGDNDADAANGASVTVAPGGSAELTFVNKQKKATIIVTKDVVKSDGSAVSDDNTFEVTLNGETKDFSESTPAVFTVNPGTYSAVESAEPNYTEFSNDSPETVPSNGQGTILIVNKQHAGSISGFKFEAGTVTGIAGWTINLFSCVTFGVNCNTLVATTTTAANGFYSFTNLLTGFYQVVEDLTNPNYTAVGATSHNVEITPGSTSTQNNFSNFENVDLSGYKFSDPNHNGIWDNGEPALPGWAITLSGTTGANTITDNNGHYVFSNLGPGTYTISETQQNGWEQTSPSNPNSHTVTPSSGEDVANLNFGNFQILPGLANTKLLTSSTTAMEGDTVTFTITAENTGNVTLYNAVITDTYDADHLTYMSSSPISADTHTGAVTDSGDYDNDGNTTEMIRTLTWDIGDLDPGETYTITLSFTAILYTEEPTVTGNVAQTTSCQEDDQTCSPEDTVTAPETQATVDIDRPGSVSGQKFVDTNGNGTWDNGEPTLNGVTVELQTPQGGLLASTATSNDGNYSFVNLLTGSYQLCEVVPTGYVKTYPAGCHEFSITDDGEVIEDKDFGNQGQGTIIVEKEVEPEDEETFDFLITGSLIEQIGVTLGDGESENYTLPAGTYTVTETPNELYATVRVCTDETLVLDPGETITCTFTNTRNTGTIIVHKIIDPDGNLEDDSDQYPGENWEMGVDGFGDATDFNLQSTDALGSTTFSPANTGQYNIREINQYGYDLVDYYCDNGVADDDIIFITVAADQTVNCTFINSPNGTIHGQKWHDRDGNGVRNGEEEFLNEWRIFLDENENETWDEGEQFMFTQAHNEEQGWYWFEHLFPGTYSVCEELQPGWAQTSPNPSCHTVELQIRGTNTCSQFEQLNAVGGPTCDFGNQQLNPILTITKENNTGGGNRQPGDSVQFTITVTATQSAAFNVTVTDLPAGGFVPRDGTYTANSSVRGDILSLTGDPGYASPGVWNLGDMIKDEVVTLTYLADIVGDIQAGVYHDLAWAAGCKTNDSCTYGDSFHVLSNATNPGFVADNYVGTTVTIVRTPSEGVNLEHKGEVLGASTELPATGANPIFMYIAFAFVTVGISFGTLGWLLRRRYE